MAKFKVGDKAKIRSAFTRKDFILESNYKAYLSICGQECEITGISYWSDRYQCIRYDIITASGINGDAPEIILEPLISPKAEDRDLAKVRNLIRTLTHTEPVCPASTIKSTRTV